MFNVTERACQELKLTLKTYATEPEQVLRLSPGPQGFFLTLDIEREGDEVITWEGEKVLLIGSDIMPFVEGATLDCIDTPEGPRLTISRPEEKE